MKKITALLIAAILAAFSFTGCSGQDETKSASGSSTSPGASSVSETNSDDDKDKTSSSETDKEGMEIYNQLFNLENKVSVEISMDKEEIDKLNEDFNKYTAKDENCKSETYRKADVTFRIGKNSYTVDEVGIRLKGNQSIEPVFDDEGNPNICSFKLSFDETFDNQDLYGDQAKKWPSSGQKKKKKKRTFATLNGLDLKWNICYDMTNIREIYATKLFEETDCLVQKIGLSQLSLNGNNYGLVKIYEPVDKEFLKKRLPEDALGGDLYKCMWSECDITGSRIGFWRGASYTDFNCYGIQDNPNGIKYNFNLKTNKKTSRHEYIINFLEVLNKNDLKKDDLEKILDTDNYASFMAAGYFAGDPDDIRNNYNNHYIYFRKDNGKAMFIIYDNDRTLGITYGLNKNCAKADPYSDTAMCFNSQDNPLISKTVTHSASPEFLYIRDKYSDALKKLSQSDMMKSDEDFNKMYNKAKANYEDIVTPYTTFANQEKDFGFSLDGKKKGGNRVNMSFEQFRSQIIETYNNSKP